MKNKFCGIKYFVSRFFVYFLIFFVYVESFAGWDPAVFVNTGIGARAISMGGAFVSIVGDGSSVFWNPAGLGGLNNIEVSFMGQMLSSSEWETLQYITPKYQCVSIIVPIKIFFVLENPVLGVGWINNSLDKIPLVYDNYNVRDEFASVDNAFLISYADRLTIRDKERIYFGFGIRAITQQFTKIEAATSFGYDIVGGIIYKEKNTNFGFMINRGPVVKWDSGNTDTGPLGVRFGISHRFLILYSMCFLPSIDIVQKQNYPLMSNLGFEFNWMMRGVVKDIFLRAGVEGYVLEDRYGYLEKMNKNLNITAGTGLRFEYSFLKFSIDYMYGIYNLGNKHRFSFSWYF